MKIDLNNMQKQIIQNKINKGFNTTDMNQEFVLLYGEVAEAYDAWKQHKDNMGEELADVAIYLLGIAELNNISLMDEIEHKVQINKNRKYKIDEKRNAFKVKTKGEEERK